MSKIVIVTKEERIKSILKIVGYVAFAIFMTVFFVLIFRYTVTFFFYNDTNGFVTSDNWCSAESDDTRCEYCSGIRLFSNCFGEIKTRGNNKLPPEPSNSNVEVNIDPLEFISEE